MASTTPCEARHVEHESASTFIVGGGPVVEAIGGVGTVILAILGLAAVLPPLHGRRARATGLRGGGRAGVGGGALSIGSALPPGVTSIGASMASVFSH